MAKGDLTLKQQLFVEAYLGKANGNATEAARIAGYKGSDKQLGVIGAQNLAKLSISQLVETRIAAVAMGADDVLRELTDIAKAPWRDFIEIRTDSHGDLKVNLQLRDKLKALELLGKYHRLFVDEIKNSGQLEIVVKREQRTGTTKTD